MKSIFLILVVCLSINYQLLAQKTPNLLALESVLNEKSKQIDSGYDAIRALRVELDNYYNIQDSTTKKHGIIAAYNTLFSTITSIIVENLDTPYFSSGKINALNESNDNLERYSTFIRQFYWDNLSDKPRVLKVDYDSLPYDSLYNNEYLKLLIDDYNQNLESVERRMGRLIQGTFVGDEHYVTPTALTRLNLALYELQFARQNIIYELNRSSVKLNKIDSVTERTSNIADGLYSDLFGVPKYRRLYFGGSFDTNESIGASVYFAKKFDFGLDVMYTNIPNPGLVIHPKVGYGQGLFHFAIGGYWNLTEDIIEPTVNVFVITNNVLGSLGFTKDRFLLQVGLRIHKFGQNTNTEASNNP
ncbi:MAG: hypothetical protein L3J29_04800 [Cyclobacteriaceae bacterium]|nr:hypothetical protein [Cyclobacteriaceae bacterium]